MFQKKLLSLVLAASFGALAVPDDIRFTASLPKTRSGKIMRRLLKEICAGGAVKGDTTTLDDLSGRPQYLLDSWAPMRELV